MKMFNKGIEINSELINNFLSNNNQKKKIESIKDKDKNKISSNKNNNFQKITGSGSINTSGSNPIIVFKKNSSKKNSFEYNQMNPKKNSQKSKNEYISDGGLSQKLQKYNTNTVNNNANNNMNNIYFNNFINEKNQQYPNNKNLKNNNLGNNQNNNSNTNNNTKKSREQQQLFSKTLREFNKRPAIPKNEKSKDVNINNKNNNDLKKLKNKSVNQNINNIKIGNNNTKTNRTKKLNIEDSKVQEEKKLIIMKQLVENGVVNEIKKLQNKKKTTQKERKD